MIENNELTITLEEQEYFKNSVAHATGLYSIAIFSPSANIKETEIGSGTFVTIGGIKGLLTNDHVARIFIDKNLSYIRLLHSTPDPKFLRFEWIIKLPALKPGNGVDLAFLILHPSAYEIVESLGKQFWSLDQSAQEWKPLACDDIKGGIWAVNGVLDESKKMKDNHPAPPYKVFVYEEGPNIIIPNIIECRPCSYDIPPIKFTVNVDYITCYLQTKNKIPKSFEGISGGGLWKVIFKDKEIQKIILYGVATEYGPEAKAEFLQCRGPITLYQTFYPFCLGMLYADWLAKSK